MERLAAVLLVVVTGIGLEVSVAAQPFQGGNGNGKEALSDAIAESIDDGPVIDGQVLEDPIWVAIAPVTGFTQTTPEEAHQHLNGLKSASPIPPTRYFLE